MESRSPLFRPRRGPLPLGSPTPDAAVAADNTAATQVPVVPAIDWLFMEWI